MKKFTWIDWLLLAIILFGLGYGVYSWVSKVRTQGIKNSSIKTEEKVLNTKEIFVDVGGEVEKAGVYKLENGARMKDALAAAGGLSAKADREYVAQSLNLAEKLIDGQKIYVPAVPTSSHSAEASFGTSLGARQQVVSAKININKADLATLESLSGIGEVRAQAIVDGRPYQAVNDLLTRKIVPASVYEKIKDKISVY